MLPTPAGPTLAPPATVTLEGAAQIRPELARAWAQLSALVDDRWRQFLALPGEVLRDGPPPATESLKSALARYDSVAADPQYRALAERPEFQAAHGLLRAYLDTLAPEAGPKLALPPPPDGPR